MNWGNKELGLGLVIVGAIALVTSTFLPMIEPTGMFSFVQQNTLIQHDGWLLVVAAVAIAASGIRAYYGTEWIAPLVISIVSAIGLAILAANEDMRTLYPIGADGDPDTTSPGSVGSWGIAIYVAGLGIALALFGSTMLRNGVAGISSAMKKKCPDCAERVLADAQVCKHCGYRFGKADTRDGGSYLKPTAQADGETRKVKCFNCGHPQEIWADATTVPCAECGAKMKIAPRACT
jgi:ribosomal protein S27E